MIRSTRWLLGILMIAVLPAIGCGNGGHDVTRYSSYTYEFCMNCPGLNGSECAQYCPSNGCTTGSKTANSQPEHCAMLRDEPSNSYCMRNKRAELFVQMQCSGSF